MTKAELVTLIAAEAEMETPRGRFMIERVLEAFVTVVADELAQGHDVRLTRFGRFEVVQRRQSKRRNPRTGETFITPPRAAIAFRSSALLVEKINVAQK